MLAHSFVLLVDITNFLSFLSCSYGGNEETDLPLVTDSKCNDSRAIAGNIVLAPWLADF